MKTVAFVGLSSNLPSQKGTPAENLEQGLLLLAKQAEILSLSKCYLTYPLDVQEEMPNFLNQVVKISWKGTARKLLELLLGIENRLGRTRPQDKSRGATARTLDLDLLLFGEEEWNLPELLVPHPKILERAFVLVPLLDIWADGDIFPNTANPRVFLEKALNDLDWSINNQYIVQNQT